MRFCANFQLELTEMQKIFKTTKIIKMFCFCFFFISANFRWILALKRTKVMNLLVLLTPWSRHPYGQLSSGVLRFVLNISLQWRRLAEFFGFFKTISHFSLISLVPKIVIFSVSIATKLTISKIYHLIRLRYEWSEHKKSQFGEGILIT